MPMPSLSIFSIQMYWSSKELLESNNLLAGWSGFKPESTPLQSNTITGWLANCVNNHANCSPTVPGRQIFPKRVLNVGDETTDPFLVEPAADNRSGRWVALSYCWGGEPSMKLTKDNIVRLKQGIPLDRFDATIQDAILVTRALGLTYLWIDALCTSQDRDSQD